MSSPAVRLDRLSGWQLPPEGALRAGQVRPIRAFDTPDQALAFIKAHGSRNKRARARRNRGAAMVKLEVGPAVLDALCRARYLPTAAVTDWAAVERAMATLVDDWRRFWG